MTRTYVHQLLHAYRRGHQLLAGSTRLKSQNADMVARLSDLSGSLTTEAEFRPYVTAYPLPSGDFYAIAKTWLDINAPRAGCVVTHTLLIPVDDWGKTTDPHCFADFFALPSSTNDVERYQVAIDYDGPQSIKPVHLQSPTREVGVKFVARYFGEGLRPLVWFGERHPEDVFWLLLSAIWPGLRMQFACCTLSLQPRVLEGRPFDLMFAPSSAYSRFQKIPRENFLDASSPIIDSRLPGNGGDTWYRDWASAIFGGHDAKNVIAKELKEFGPYMGDDPTAVRKLFLIDGLRKRIKDSPTAAVGLMDMVESLAPEGAQANDYKKDMMAIALRAAARVSDSAEALKCYFLIDERFRRSAYSKVSLKLWPELSSGVASRTCEYPEAALNVGERLFGPQSLVLGSAFARGIVAGLLKLAANAPEQLGVLSHFPEAAPSIIANEPPIALSYLRGMKTLKSDRSDGKDLSTWIALVTDSDARGRIRGVLLPEIKSDEEAPIVEELLKNLAEEDICDVLDILAKSTGGFSPRKIRQVASEQLAYIYPHYIREWGRRTNVWSSDTAALIAASYTGDREGFKELLRNPLSDPGREAQVMAAFLEMVAVAQLPYWLREHARQSPDFLVPLLALGSDTPPDVAHVLQNVLDEVQEIPIAKELNLVNKIDSFQTFPFGSSLINLAMRSAIGGFIAGEIDWEACETWQSTDWGSRWMEKVTAWDLQSLVSRKRFDDESELGRAWKWVAAAPEALYRRSPSLLPNLIEDLVSPRPWDWNAAFTESWIVVIQRSSHQAQKSTYLKLCADALNFAFSHEHYPLGNLVAHSFSTVYVAVTESTVTPHETSTLFSFFDWDKGKELRKKLVNSFLKSTWPPGDLALAVRDQWLLRKIFKRIMRRWHGKRYIEEMLKDLAGREDPDTGRLYSELKELAQNPDFYEPWD